eukprot:GEMP01038408.1.p1 GENE.GEMP01038408.1~~GEMP01038408.1.p1  ORF type:complete len:488 (+),score=27.64 GEMP01038408.1:166-1629(+)
MFPWRPRLTRSLCLGLSSRWFSRFRSFENAREFVKGLQLRNQKEWQMFSKSGARPRDIPSTPSVTYENSGWVSLREFLGNSVDSRFRCFEEAREFARALRLRNQKEWQAFSKSAARPHDIPSNPSLAYGGKGWVSLHDFLGVAAKSTKKGTKRENTKRKDHECSAASASYETNKSLATQSRAIHVILSHCQKSSAIEMANVGENGRANLIVRESISQRWFGIRVRSSSSMSSRGFFEFRHHSNNIGLLVIFLALFPIFRCWVVHGSTLQTSRTNIGSHNKWKECEVSLEDLPIRICAALRRDTLVELPLSDWYLPISPSHQVERHLRNEIVKKLFDPIGWTIHDPRINNSIVDFITDSGLRVQCKTARSLQSQRGLLFDIYKFGGRIEGKNIRQPYSVRDQIDFFLVYVRFPNGHLRGVFVFSKEEATKHGWLRGDGHQGKVGTYVYPPFVSLPPVYEIKHRWQRERYLDLSVQKVDVERARELFLG